MALEGEREVQITQSPSDAAETRGPILASGVGLSTLCLADCHRPVAPFYFSALFQSLLSTGFFSGSEILFPYELLKSQALSWRSVLVYNPDS